MQINIAFLINKQKILMDTSDEHFNGPSNFIHPILLSILIYFFFKFRIFLKVSIYKFKMITIQKEIERGREIEREEGK